MNEKVREQLLEIADILENQDKSNKCDFVTLAKCIFKIKNILKTNVLSDYEIKVLNNSVEELQKIATDSKLQINKTLTETSKI